MVLASLRKWLCTLSWVSESSLSLSASYCWSASTSIVNLISSRGSQWGYFDAKLKSLRLIVPVTAKPRISFAHPRGRGWSINCKGDALRYTCKCKISDDLKVTRLAGNSGRFERHGRVFLDSEKVGRLKVCIAHWIVSRDGSGGNDGFNHWTWKGPSRSKSRCL